MSTLLQVEQITPQHLTLLFKHGKSTTVMSVLPSQTIAEIKSKLLEVLRSRNMTTFPNTDILLPEDGEQLEFGILADRRDPSKGWVFAEDRSTIPQAAGASKKKGAAKKDGPITAFEDLDLKDSSPVAYRLKADAADSIDPDVEDLEMKDDPGWNVVLPTYDEEDDDAEGQADDADEMDIPIPMPRNNIAR